MTEGGSWRAAVVVGGLTGLAVWLVGLNTTQSLLIGASVAAVRAGTALLHLGYEPTWPSLVDPLNDGLRRDVSRLSWTLSGPDGTVGAMAVARVRVLTERRLAERQLTLDDREAATELLGKAAYDVAIAEPLAPVHRRALNTALTTLERLDRRGATP